MNPLSLRPPATLAFTALILSAPFARAADAPPAYMLTNLGTLGGDNSYAYSINNAGQIVGATDTLATGVDGFLFTAGKMQDLGKNIDKATAINDAGQIVGWDDTDGVQAFLLTAGRVQRWGDFGPRVDGTIPDGHAYGINRSGQVVGRATGHAFVRTKATMKDLGVLNGGGRISEARAVNDAGLVAGWSEIVPVPEPVPRKPADIHAFLYADGHMQDLGTLGGTFSCAFGLNAAGTVVGTATTADGSRHAFVRDSGPLRDVGTLGGKNSVAHAINTAGEIVGTAWDDAPDGRFTEQHAFVYRDGKMMDLNRLVGDPALSAAGLKVLVRALGLNDRGQIVGEARDAAGHTLAFLLTPAIAGAAAAPPPKPPSGFTPAGKGLQFPKGPPDGPGVVTKNARSGGMVPFEGVDLVELDALQIRPPLANYSAGLADLSRGAGLKNASVAGPTWVFLSGKSGPTFSYLSEFSGENFSAVEISVNEAGQAEWDSANTGLFSHLLEIVHHRLPALPEVRAGTFEPRLVVGLPTYPSFVWLKSTTDDNDFIYPVGVEFARPLEEQLYPAAEFLKIYQDVLKERNPEVKLVMPPVSTANPNIPIPTTPSHLTSKVTALVRIALAGAADAISDGDWELGPEFTLSESSHGCRIAWIAPGRDTDKRHLVVDGVAGTEYDGIADVHFSADGRHVAYLATTEGQGSQAVVDGKPGPLFKDACEELLLSPDGQHYAFTTEPPGHCQMVEDGQAGPAFNSVLQAGFSTDGQHLCYLGMNTLADGTRASQIVMDGKTGPVITGEIRTLVLGPDGQHCAYVRAAARTEQIVVDGIPGRSFQTVDQLCFSPDGKHFAYLGKTSGVTSDAQVVLDGQPSPSLGEAGQSSILRFSPDGQHFAYVTHSHVVLDGKSGLSGTPALATEFRPEGGGFIFSANSAHTAYIMNDDKAGQQAVVDGQPGPAFPGHVYDLTLSSDGRHSAFAVEFGRFEHGGNPTIFHQGNWEVVLDGQPGPKFDAVGPRFAFSPDGNHVAYAAETAKQWRVYADGTTGPAFDHIVAGPVVCNDGRLEYLALQKDGTATNLVRVTMPGFVPATP